MGLNDLCGAQRQQIQLQCHKTTIIFKNAQIMLITFVSLMCQFNVRSKSQQKNIAKLQTVVTLHI